MYKKLFLIVGLTCAALFTGAARVIVVNPVNVARVDEPVILSQKYLLKKYGELKQNEVFVPFNSSGVVLPFQCDDLNGDGVCDELFFLVDMQANEKLTVQIKKVDKKTLPSFTVRTNLRLGYKHGQGSGMTVTEADAGDRIGGFDTNVSQKLMQFEGPGWENDKVAFRNYFDQRNGMDIFGKVTDKMVMDSVVGIKGTYHVMGWWGMDILKVNNSLGAGAIALYYNGKYYRVNGGKSTYKKIIEGPLRSVFDLNFQGVDVDGHQLNINHRISIEAGKFYYNNQITVQPEKGMDILVGFADLHKVKAELYQTKKSDFSFAYGIQSYSDEPLGFGVLIAKKYKSAIYDLDNHELGLDNALVTQSHIVRPTKPCGGGVQYRFYACWEKTDTAFVNKDKMAAFLHKEQLLFDNPVKVKL